MTEDSGYCVKERRFYSDLGDAFQECPNGHLLSHKTDCPICGRTMGYWQDDDDYCGPDQETLICINCVHALTNPSPAEQYPPSASKA